MKYIFLSLKARKVLTESGLADPALGVEEGGDHRGGHVLQVELVAGEGEQTEHDHVQDRLPAHIQKVIL